MDINKHLEAARRVEIARQALATAEAEYAALIGGQAPRSRSQPPRRAVRGSSGPSVSQRVLGLVVDSGRTGIARRDILDIIGAAHEAAVHSALKAHAQAGRIRNDAGQWVTVDRDAQTRPMRMPPANPYAEPQ